MISPNTRPTSTRRRSSLPVVGALIVSLVGTGVTGSLCMGQRQALETKRGHTVNHQANLSNMNSFALGLLLGGLRGPLVMALWTSSENQKTEHDLADFDTKVELIRLLQPEFDTVHLFQIWNKAYNISVQMSNVANKYTAILDALDYAYSVDQERPDDINIIASIGGLYFDKFGGSTERFYFSPRVRDESRPDEAFVRVIFAPEKLVDVQRAARFSGAPVYALTARDAGGDSGKQMLVLRKSVADAMQKRAADLATFEPQPFHSITRHDAAGRRLEQDVLLDDKGNVLQQFLTPRAGHTASGDAADGSPLPYLTKFQPYPLGVSPYALGYNYYKRCQWLMLNRGAHHAQMADRVLSSRPALALEKWSEEEWYTALRGEIELSGQTPPLDDGNLQQPTRDHVIGDPLPSCPLFDQTIQHFERGVAVAGQAIAEYEEHIQRYTEDELTYRSHIRDVSARRELLSGDAAYLRTMSTTGEARTQFAAQARTHYAAAANLYGRLYMRYFMSDDDAKAVLPKDVRNLKRVDVDPEMGRLRDEEVPEVMGKLVQLYRSNQGVNSEDFQEIYGYIDRCYARLRNLAIVR